jgi:hypothetical protein
MSPRFAAFAANYLAELPLALAVIFALAAVGLVCYLAGSGAAVVLAMLFMIAVVEIVWRMARRRA